MMRALIAFLMAVALTVMPAMAESAGNATPPTGDGIPASESPAAEPGPMIEFPAPDGDEAPLLALDPTTQQSGDVVLPEDGTEDGVRMVLKERPLPLAGVKIGIDPGHQAHGNSEKEAVAPGSRQTKAKVSSGATGVSTHIPEYVTVLEISLKLRDALEEVGAEVVMTRETHDVNLSNQERARMMSAAGVDLWLRVHCDSVNSRSKNGVALYCSRSNAIAEESRRAAEAILPEVCAVTGAKANGIVVNDDYTGQNWSTVPCIMVECGFASNPDEDRLLNDEGYQWKLAEGLTNGIAAYIAERDETVWE